MIPRPQPVDSQYHIFFQSSRYLRLYDLVLHMFFYRGEFLYLDPWLSTIAETEERSGGVS